MREKRIEYSLEVKYVNDFMLYHNIAPYNIKYYSVPFNDDKLCTVHKM